MAGGDFQTLARKIDKEDFAAKTKHQPCPKYNGENKFSSQSGKKL